MAVQGQEFAEAKWSLAERARERTDAAVEAAFARGDLLRTHVLRPTWHLVARADVRWLLRLTRPRVHALNRPYYARLGLDGALLARGHEVLAGALAGGVPLTRPELGARLAAAGIAAEGPRLAYLLMHAELEEVLASGPRRGRLHTYALLDERAPRAAGDELPREDALDRLAARYFASHGPATAHDLAAWASLTLAEVRAALARVGGALRREDDDEGTAWYSAPTRPGATAEGESRGYLVPMYDETVVAYRSPRVALAHPPPGPGLLERPIVVGGRTLGSWRRTIARGAVTVEARLFGPASAGEEAALRAAVARFGRFLGLPATLEAQHLAPAAPRP